MTQSRGRSALVRDDELSDLAHFVQWVLSSEPRPQLQTVTGWSGSFGRVQAKATHGVKGKGVDQDVLPYRIELQFYGAGQSVMLAFESGRGATVSSAGQGGWTKAKKPIELFLRSHFAGSRLVHLEMAEALIFEFQNGNRLMLLARKEPYDHLCLRAEAVSLEKAVEARLSPIDALDVASETQLPQTERLDSQAPSPEGSPRQIEKLKRAIVKVEREIATKSSDRERKCAKWIIENQSLDVPPDLNDLIKPGWMSVGQAANELFSAAKRNEKKLSRTQDRLLELKRELERTVSHFAQRAERSAEASGEQRAGARHLEPRDRAESRNEESLLRQAKARGRTVRLDERLTLYVGKSAQENLSLLRQAQPFDYWLHIKDEPGAHGILRRPRGVAPTPAQFQLAAQWVLFYSLKQKRAQEASGQPFDVLLAQCRYVRPIKGDRLGRVQHTQAEVIRVVFDPVALQT